MYNLKYSYSLTLFLLYKSIINNTLYFLQNKTIYFIVCTIFDSLRSKFELLSSSEV